MRNKILSTVFSLLSCGVFILFSSNLLYAQGLSDTARDQKEAAIEDRRDAALERKPQTAEQILEYLKDRASQIKKERRMKQLLKFKWSAGISLGHEDNAANDAFQKGDDFEQTDFSFNWQPAFTKDFTGDFGYRYTNQEYFEQDTLTTVDHALNSTFKIYPFDSGKLLLEPGFEYEWLIYPNDVNSEYEQYKTFMGFKLYPSKKWNYGGKYEYSHKIYDKKAARNPAEANLNYPREDFRNSLELWVKRFIGPYAITLKEKSYRNNSNDEFQKFNDYDDHRFYLTVARSFLKDQKLYVSYTSDYEIKAYVSQKGDEGIGRHDQIIEHKMNAYYTIKKHWTFDYALTYKKSGSNLATGVFKNLTNKIGLTVDF